MLCMLALLIHGSAALVPVNDRPQRLWQILEQPDKARTWKTVFGETGERGEYMDGYSEQAMFDRCDQDYKWAKKFSPDDFLSERAKMVRGPSMIPALNRAVTVTSPIYSPVRRCRTFTATSACGST